MKTTTPATPHKTDTAAHSSRAAARAAHARRARGTRQAGSRGAFRAFVAALDQRDVGMTVPYRDASR